MSFIWDRANLTTPAKIGDFEAAGSIVVLTAYVDDYAEVLDQWADVTTRVTPARPRSRADTVKPGDKSWIAIFGINGPISVAPMNFVWFREAKIGFFR